MLPERMMEQTNETLITEFVLLGFVNLAWLQKYLFFLVLFFYILDICGNCIIVFLVSTEHALHSPMYFLLGSLSVLDIFFSTVTVPKMMYGFLMENTISKIGCLTQMYFFHFLGCAEGVTLASMGYDRYVAICHPLRYKTIMGRMTCIQLVFISWFTGLSTSLIHAVMTSQLPFCNKRIIKHFYCDVKPVIKLACKDITVNELTLAVVSGFLSTGTFFLTILSYFFIIVTLIKMKSSKGRVKIFSTCSSHLTVVILFYGTAMCTYLGPASENSLEKDSVAAILITVITPTVNPMIYTLRNKEVWKSLQKFLKKAKHFAVVGFTADLELTAICEGSLLQAAVTLHLYISNAEITDGLRGTANASEGFSSDESFSSNKNFQIWVSNGNETANENGNVSKVSKIRVPGHGYGTENTWFYITYEKHPDCPGVTPPNSA
ncbi:olfactory receptor 12D2-like [Gastrophryne carolinensis]